MESSSWNCFVSLGDVEVDPSLWKGNLAHVLKPINFFPRNQFKSKLVSSVIRWSFELYRRTIYVKMIEIVLPGLADYLYRNFSNAVHFVALTFLNFLTREPTTGDAFQL